MSSADAHINNTTHAHTHTHSKRNMKTHTTHIHKDVHWEGSAAMVLWWPSVAGRALPPLPARLPPLGEGGLNEEDSGAAAAVA